MIPESVKSKIDVVAVPTTFLGYFKAIPWPEIAACLGAIYTALRIGEWMVSRWKKRKGRGHP